MQILPKNAVLYSLMIEDLDNRERYLLPTVKKILLNKVKAKDYNLNMNMFMSYFNVTELSARKMIHNIEINTFLQRVFIINNGGNDYKEDDEICNAKIQERNSRNI